MFRRFRRRRPSSIMILTPDGKGAVPPAWSFPAGLDLQRDTTPAHWIEEALPKYPWATAGSLVPDGFAAYARILHPGQRRTEDGGWEDVSWAEVAAANGTVVHPHMSFAGIARLGKDPNEQPPGMHRPLEGVPDQPILRSLKRVLSAHTSGHEPCWYGVWEGDGSLSILEGYDERTHPKIEVPGRKYLLLTGTLDALDLFAATDYIDGPNIWWPEDHAWCVASEIDLDSTYVGGSAECIEQLLASDDLEALPAELEDRVDGGADTININGTHEGGPP